MQTAMKGAVRDVYGTAEVVSVRELETPVARDDEVLVRVAAVALNASDWEFLSGTPAYVRAWGLFRPGVKALGLAQSLQEVTHWLYTHTHVDHMGAAALLSQDSAAPQLAWEAISPQLERWHSFQDELADWSWWVRQAFVEPGRGQLLELTKTERPSGRRVSLVQEHGELAIKHFSPLKLGERFDVGSLTLEVIDARGHDPFHVAFWEKTRGWLFSGDVVLPVPTPLSPPMHDDLALYEASLARLSALPALWDGQLAWRRSASWSEVSSVVMTTTTWTSCSLRSMKTASSPRLTTSP